MSSKAAFIFDMDGVLTDNMRHHADSWVELFRDYGLEGLDAERYLVETAGMKGHDVLRYFLDPNISAAEADHLTELKDFLYRVSSRSAIQPLPGLGAFLAKAAERGIKLAIGSGPAIKTSTSSWTFSAFAAPSTQLSPRRMLSGENPIPIFFCGQRNCLMFPPPHALCSKTPFPALKQPEAPAWQP